MTIRLAVDCMGGDFGPSVVLPAVLSVLDSCLDAFFFLVGDSSIINSWLSAQCPSRFLSRLEVVHTSQVVEMDEEPMAALRRKKDSSLARIMEIVRDNHADVCVSAGNTGALMAFSYFIIKTFDCIDRPAIAHLIPAKKGSFYMLDLGANVDCRPQHLFQFAIMGSVLSMVTEGVSSPRIGLLNVGDEETKGNALVKEVSQLMRSSSLNFSGSIEGSKIFSGLVDVVVCDGFVGNVVLKSLEGFARMFSSAIREESQRSLFRRFVSFLSYPAIRDVRHRFDWRTHNGACLVGLRSLVVKSHGTADSYAFSSALHYGLKMVRGSFLCRLEDNLNQALKK